MSDDQELRRLAHTRALMLGSSAFPPSVHLAYLRDAGPERGGGLGRLTVGDFVLRDVAMPIEQAEVIRVVAETLIAFGQPGVMLSPAMISSVPPSLASARMTWFGLEREGQLVGLHGGFFWNDRLWVRRFYAILGTQPPPEVAGEIETLIYGHLWDRGLREAMIQLPVNTPNLAARRAAGWQDSHEMHFAGNARPFMWLRRAFRARRTVPTFPSRWGPVEVREGTWDDVRAIRDQELEAWWSGASEHRARVARSIAHLYGMESASALLGTLEGRLRYGYLIRESSDESTAAVISALHPPGVHRSASSFYYAAMAWMAAAGYETYKAYIRPDCSGRNALVHDCLAQGGTLRWIPELQKVLTSYPLARVLAQPLEVYTAHWEALVAADPSDAALPPEFPAEALEWARAATP